MEGKAVEINKESWEEFLETKLDDDDRSRPLEFIYLQPHPMTNRIYATCTRCNMKYGVYFLDESFSQTSQTAQDGDRDERSPCGASKTSPRI